jgi:hypothetical protein
LFVHPEEFAVGDIDRMDRKELINTLLEFNHRSTFHFTRDWLKKQWTRRLRSLLRAALQPYPAGDLEGAVGEGRSRTAVRPGESQFQPA